LPNNCLNKTSVVVPKVPSSVIAVVGPPNPVQDAVTSYLAELFVIQTAADPKTPAYVFKHFANQTELFTYISSEQYFNITAGFQGVCFGYEITQNSANSYDVNMFFND
jgi:hypothetical protein